MDLKVKNIEQYSRYRLAEMHERDTKIGEVWTHTVFIDRPDGESISLSKAELKEMIALMDKCPFGRED